jgi:formylglycine-generating enzyme required for sulfatase activity
LARVAWYGPNSGGRSHPVGQKEPNAWGLYDMHGNVWEWCEDLFGGYSIRTATGPKGAATGDMRVLLRGGSWGYLPWFCRAAYRSRVGPGHRIDFCGFRVVVARTP